MAMLQGKPSSRPLGALQGDSRQQLAVAARASLTGAVVRPHPADHTADPFSRVSEFYFEAHELKVVRVEPAPLDDSEYW